MKANACDRATKAEIIRFLAALLRSDLDTTEGLDALAAQHSTDRQTIRDYAMGVVQSLEERAVRLSRPQ